MRPDPFGSALGQTGERGLFLQGGQVGHADLGRDCKEAAVAFLGDMRRQGIHALIVPDESIKRRRFIEPPTDLVNVAT